MSIKNNVRILTTLAILAAVSVFHLSCSTVAVTGRKQLALIPSSQMLGMSYQEYDSFLKSHKLSSNAEQTQMVKRVGDNIQKAVEEYFAQQKMSSALKDYKWEFNLVESEEVNAWCMPGGKVVVYSGLLPVTQNEEGLAVVMGHEIAHAVAEHGRERVSQVMLAQGLGMGFQQLIKNEPKRAQGIWMTAFGVTAQVGGLLPYSRLHESEADHLGLIFMSMAGYDPNSAVAFWERMAAKKGGQSPPEFLSTHPSDETRIKKIKESIPEAMKYYRKS